MINTIKNFKWFFAVSFLCLLLGVLTFITFINQNFIFLKENNLQFLLKLDVALLVVFLILLIRETSKIFYEYKDKLKNFKDYIRIPDYNNKINSFHLIILNINFRYKLKYQILINI